MNSIQIRITDGFQARPLVDPFYEQNGGRACARPDDLFFLAMEGSTLLACVRYCVENETPMLRTMMVGAAWRRKGIGTRLLEAFSARLDEHGIHDVFCLPYSHLEQFYGSAGFKRIAVTEAPAFLNERMIMYDPTGTRYLCMKRP